MHVDRVHDVAIIELMFHMNVYILFENVYILINIYIYTYIYEKLPLNACDRYSLWH